MQKFHSGRAHSADHVARPNERILRAGAKEDAIRVIANGKRTGGISPDEVVVDRVAGINRAGRAPYIVTEGNWIVNAADGVVCDLVVIGLDADAAALQRNRGVLEIST